MRDRSKPEHDLAAIRAAIASRDPARFRLDDRVALEHIPQLGLAMEDVVDILRSLTPEHFLWREQAEHVDYAGAWYDVYFVPFSAKKGYWIKVDIEPEGFVRVFSFHRSKKPKDA